MLSRICVGQIRPDAGILCRRKNSKVDPDLFVSDVLHPRYMERNLLSAQFIGHASIYE